MRPPRGVELSTPGARRPRRLHHGPPPGLLAWCEALYQHRPEVWLVTLAADAFDYGLYDLSPAAHAAVVPMLERVRGLIAGVRPATI